MVGYPTYSGFCQTRQPRGRMLADFFQALPEYTTIIPDKKILVNPIKQQCSHFHRCDTNALHEIGSNNSLLQEHSHYKYLLNMPHKTRLSYAAFFLTGTDRNSRLDLFHSGWWGACACLRWPAYYYLRWNRPELGRPISLFRTWRISITKA